MSLVLERDPARFGGLKMAVALLPGPGCLVKHDNFGVGQVVESKIENDLPMVKVRWPQSKTIEWHSLRELSCGFRRGDTSRTARTPVLAKLWAPE